MVPYRKVPAAVGPDEFILLRCGQRLGTLPIIVGKDRLRLETVN
ncbi:MAG: hypothetical protein PF508_13055 [Spirochaeta sp.]|nr:hypothetical protein [Spirochaeta sp.]